MASDLETTTFKQSCSCESGWQLHRASHPEPQPLRAQRTLNSTAWLGLPVSQEASDLRRLLCPKSQIKEAGEIPDDFQSQVFFLLQQGHQLPRDWLCLFISKYLDSLLNSAPALMLTNNSSNKSSPHMPLVSEDRLHWGLSRQMAKTQGRASPGSGTAWWVIWLKQQQQQQKSNKQAEEGPWSHERWESLQPVSTLYTREVAGLFCIAHSPSRGQPRRENVLAHIG